MMAVFPLASVMRNFPALTPLPPLSWARGVCDARLPPPCSIVSVPAPTSALLLA